MDTHVKVLGSVQIAFGILGVCAAVLLSIVMGGAASIVGMAVADDPDAAIVVPIIGITGVMLVTVLVVLSLPSILIGIALLQRRPWARIAGIVLSLLSLMLIPFGTLVGIYGLWVLFSKDTERIFSATTPTSVA